MVQMIDLVRCLSFLLFAVLTVSNEEAEMGHRKIYRQESEEIKLREKKGRGEMNIERTNFKSYNFKLDRWSQFVLKPEEDQEVKAVFDAYWNQNNVYLQANVLSGEEITVTIEDINRVLIASDVFYTSGGVVFTANANRTYKITAKENGKYGKILMMHLSETIIAPNKTAKRDGMAKIHAKLLTAKIKLDNSLKSAETERFIEQKISQQILRQSSIYAYYEIAEAALIALAAVLEVKLVINLLKTDTII